MHVLKNPRLAFRNTVTRPRKMSRTWEKKMTIQEEMRKLDHAPANLRADVGVGVSVGAHVCVGAHVWVEKETRIQGVPQHTEVARMKGCRQTHEGFFWLPVKILATKQEVVKIPGEVAKVDDLTTLANAWDWKKRNGRKRQRDLKKNEFCRGRYGGEVLALVPERDHS
jgi:hypothetical protein